MDTSLSFHDEQLAERAKRRSFMRGLMAAGLGGALAAQTSSAEAACLSVSAPLPFINVKSFGAVGTGATDDTNAFQCAVNAAAAAGGGVILVPAGNYLIAGTILINSHGITIQGMGSHASVLLVPASTTVDTIRFTYSLSGAVKNLTINSAGAPATAGRAIHCYYSDVLIENLWIKDQFVSIEINGKGGRVTILGGYYNPAPLGTAVLVGGDPSLLPAPGEVHIINLVVDPGDVTPQPAYGLRLRSTEGIWVTDCDFIRCNVGLQIDPPSGRHVVHGFFSGTAWDTSATRCIVIQPHSGAVVFGMHFSNCWSATSTYDNCAIGGDVNGVQFTGHRFLNSPQGNGLWVTGPLAKNINVDASVASGIAVGTGFAFVGNATNFAVRNCTTAVHGSHAVGAILPPNRYGVQVTAGCSNYIIANNFLKENTLASIIDSGSAPKVVANNLT
ncbi:MAG: glycoside hydrolase family 55 protein [Dokdonella sp.]|nr:glycoside hydrolase family 55 protein [Dokdonella sp.]